MRETGKFCLFLKERSRRSTYLSSIWISINGSDFFFIRDFIGSCLIQRQIERKRERVMLAFRLRRKDNRLVNTSRIIVHKSSSVKRASMREIRLLGSKDVSTRPSSHRHFSPTIRSIIDTNFIESIRFNTRVFPTKSPSDHAVVSKLDTLTDILLIFESLVIARIISRIICFRRCIAELFLRLSLVHE